MKTLDDAGGDLSTEITTVNPRDVVPDHGEPREQLSDCSLPTIWRQRASGAHHAELDGEYAASAAPIRSHDRAVHLADRHDLIFAVAHVDIERIAP